MRLPCEAIFRAIYAFYQTYFCLLSNVNMITTKYLRLIIRVVVVLNSI